ncbi:hypothetical protein BCR32DRAFT_290995 [Anaeromyces robustus]|uniref:Uncharacterized protein n=1 Tax=Anaeromyces robustus TaxID=1754192 RepID=A0A1Y1XHT1_9FUNG|nr:hypothetical protein BCR32DRAFT_290995 [Anaeromyces robustus]|eukprot:ORX84936.1 hypothetical protein BCR32DRAFT_290995 [Anaeromyces robustus]
MDFKKNYNNKTKSNFPKLGKCMCCFGLSEDTSAKVCSISIALYLIYSLIKSVEVSVFFSLIYGATLISTLFLIIGLFKSKLSFMTQFIYVYLVYLILKTSSIIIICLGVFFYEKKGGFDEMLQEHNIAFSENKVAFNIGLIYGLFVSYFPLIFEVYFYLVNGSYIESIEKTLEQKLLTDVENDFTNIV